MSIQVLYPFLNGVFTFELLIVNPSSDKYGVENISHSAGYFFTLLAVSLAVQKHFYLMQSHLFICLFLFLLPVFDDVSKKPLPRPMS